MGLSLLEELAEEEARFKKFSFVGNDRVRVAGNLRTGFSVNIDEDEGEVGGGGGGGGPTGACCIGGACSLLTFVACNGAGGTWQGLGVPCDPNPCVIPTGACCDGGVCSITTAAGCMGNYLGDGTTCAGVDCTQGACCNGSDCTITAAGACAGTYHGDGTICDPNPCALPPCPCEGFTCGDGKHYLTKTTTYNVTVVVIVDGSPCNTVCTGTVTESYDPITCAYSCDAPFHIHSCGHELDFNNCSGTCIGDFGGTCHFLPGETGACPNFTFEYTCPDGASHSANGTEYGTVTTVYSNECVPPP